MKQGDFWLSLARFPFLRRRALLEARLAYADAGMMHHYTMVCAIAFQWKHFQEAA